MTMHLMSHAYSTLNTRKRKIKITKSKLERWAEELKQYNKLMKSCNSKTLTIDEYIDKIHGKYKPETKRSAYTPTTTEMQATERSRSHREKYPSMDTYNGTTPRKEPQIYTGTLIKGIATMHKSNAVPVIDKKQAEEIARMRR